MEPENKKEYEISFLLTAPAAEKELAAVLAKFGAEIYFQKPAASLQLAYKIKRQSSALFGFCHFRAIPDAIKQIKDALNLTPSVLRFLIITPPVVMQTEHVDRREMRGLMDKKPPVTSAGPMLSNEALSEKLEEILK